MHSRGGLLSLLLDNGSDPGVYCCCPLLLVPVVDFVVVVCCGGGGCLMLLANNSLADEIFFLFRSVILISSLDLFFASLIDPINNDKLSPIHIAASEGNAPVAAMLIEHGCDFECFDMQGKVRCSSIIVFGYHKNIYTVSILHIYQLIHWILFFFFFFFLQNTDSNSSCISTWTSCNCSSVVR